MVESSEREAGFTLVELLVVVSIIALSVTYLSRLFVQDMEREQWDTVVSELLTLHRAISIAYIERDGLWPGQFDLDDASCSEPEDFMLDIEPFLPEFRYSISTGDADTPVETELFSFICLEDRFEVTTTTLANESGANYIAQMLPFAAATEEGEVVMHVLKSRRRTISSLVAIDEVIAGIVEIPHPEQCESELARLDVAPDHICRPSGESAPLGGFRMLIETESDYWRVSLESQTDEADASFRSMSCDEPVRLRGVAFCAER
ncbi:MAG: type II secretion system GspH family protein [Pseudomonadales bacterium]|nr:type II secretion system GspH family protein [Pseudomonadales bacterium]